MKSPPFENAKIVIPALSREAHITILGIVNPEILVQG